MPVEDHHRTLPLQIPHETRYTYFGRYTHQHVHMIFHLMPFDQLHLIIPTQLPQYLAYAFPILVVYDLAPILRRKHDMVFSNPLRMR